MTFQNTLNEIEIIRVVKGIFIECQIIWNLNLIQVLMELLFCNVMIYYQEIVCDKLIYVWCKQQL